MGLLFFGIIGALIGILIVNLIKLIFVIIFTLKVMHIKMDVGKLIFQYASFLLTIGLVMILETLFLRDFNELLFMTLRLPIFIDLQLFSILIFMLIYVFLNIFFKVINRSEIEYIEALFKRNTRYHRIIRKWLNMLSKLIRD